jgi:hypothetical protein
MRFYEKQKYMKNWMNFEANKEKEFEDLLKLFLIVKGHFLLDKSEAIENNFVFYESMLEQLFGNHKSKARAFHQLICLEEETLADLIKSYSLPLTNEKKSVSCNYMREKLFDDLMLNHLNLDSDSFTCLRALSLVSLGKTTEVPLLVQKLKLNSDDTNLYKGI